MGRGGLIMDILENAKSHFLKVKQNEIRSLDVPEWGCTLYFKPASQLQTDRFLVHTKTGEVAKAQAQLIVSRALDADGRRVFKEGQLKALYEQADARVIRYVSDFILEGDGLEDITPEDAEKN